MSITRTSSSFGDLPEFCCDSCLQFPNRWKVVIDGHYPCDWDIPTDKNVGVQDRWMRCPLKVTLLVGQTLLKPLSQVSYSRKSFDSIFWKEYGFYANRPILLKLCGMIVHRQKLKTSRNLEINWTFVGFNKFLFVRGAPCDSSDFSYTFTQLNRPELVEC